MDRTIAYVVGLFGLAGVWYYVWYALLKQRQQHYKLIERFASTAPTFLSAAQTRAFLQADEDGYVAQLSSFDLLARHASTREAYLQAAANAAMDFTEAQRDALTRTCKEADVLLLTHNPTMASIPWKLALVDEAYEGGFPHTRGNVIFLCPRTVESADILRTLIHEKVHVWQRLYPRAMEKWMVDAGYARVALRKDERKRGLRANPDVDDWIYQDPQSGQHMAAYYAKTRPCSIGDVALSHASFEHPYEFMAYDIAAKATTQ